MTSVTILPPDGSGVDFPHHSHNLSNERTADGPASCNSIPQVSSQFGISQNPNTAHNFQATQNSPCSNCKLHERSGGVSSDNTAPADNPNLLGLPPNSAPASNKQASQVSQHPRFVADTFPHVTRPLPDGGFNSMDTNPNLGLPPRVSNSSFLGQFPKLSSNFDKADGISCQQQILPPAVPTRAPVTHRHNATSQKKLSFAEAAARKAAKPPDLFAHNLISIKPVQLNDELTVVLPEFLYEQRLASFQFALIGGISSLKALRRGQLNLCKENLCLL